MFDGTSVTCLTPNDFDKTNTSRLKKSGCCMVFFYASWCPHCREAKDTIIKLSERAKFMEVCAFDCVKYASFLNKMRTDTQELVTSFPTIVLYVNTVPVKKVNADDRQVGKLLEIGMEGCRSAHGKK